jgi:hypothetical protein
MYPPNKSFHNTYSHLMIIVQLPFYGHLILRLKWAVTLNALGSWIYIAILRLTIHFNTLLNRFNCTDKSAFITVSVHSWLPLHIRSIRWLYVHSHISASTKCIWLYVHTCSMYFVLLSSNKYINWLSISNIFLSPYSGLLALSMTFSPRVIYAPMMGITAPWQQPFFLYQDILEGKQAGSLVAWTSSCLAQSMTYFVVHYMSGWWSGRKSKCYAEPWTLVMLSSINGHCRAGSNKQLHPTLDRWWPLHLSLNDSILWENTDSLYILTQST